MLVLVAYDVSTVTRAGRSRLRKVARICNKWGRSVQKSVFECEVDAQQYRWMTEELKDVICEKEDNIRFYSLGNRYENRIMILGNGRKSWNQENFIF